MAVELRVVSPDASPEEVAAIVAAVSAAYQQQLAAASQHAPPGTPAVSQWVRASRLSARRAPYQRGEWRMSGRMGRRNRA
jgi:hypothetical protein